MPRNYEEAQEEMKAWERAQKTGEAFTPAPAKEADPALVPLSFKLSDRYTGKEQDSIIKAYNVLANGAAALNKLIASLKDGNISDSKAEETFDEFKEKFDEIQRSIPDSSVVSDIFSGIDNLLDDVSSYELSECVDELEDLVKYTAEVSMMAFGGYFNLNSDLPPVISDRACADVFKDPTLAQLYKAYHTFETNLANATKTIDTAVANFDKLTTKPATLAPIVEYFKGAINALQEAFSNGPDMQTEFAKVNKLVMKDTTEGLIDQLNNLREKFKAINLACGGLTKLVGFDDAYYNILQDSFSKAIVHPKASLVAQTLINGIYTIYRNEVITPTGSAMMNDPLNKIDSLLENVIKLIRSGQ